MEGLSEILQPYQYANEEQVKLYSRQIITPDFGIEGQEILSKSKIVMIGAGGLGSSAGLYLGGSGVGNMTIIDDDIISLSNLHRQVAHSISGYNNKLNKAESLSNRIKELHPNINIIAIKEKLTFDNYETLLSGYDIVIDCTDNFEARQLINIFTLKHKIPFVYGSIKGWEGQLSILNHNNSPCYRCVTNNGGYSQSIKDIIPVLSPLPGIIGCLQSMETIKVLLNKSDVLVGQMLYYDGLHNTFRKIKISKRVGCPYCSENGNNSNELQTNTKLVGNNNNLYETLNNDNYDRFNYIKWIDIKIETSYFLIDLRPSNEKRISGLKASVDYTYDENDLSYLFKMWEDNNKPKLFLFCRNGQKSEQLYIDFINIFPPEIVYIIEGGLSELCRIDDRLNFF